VRDDDAISALLTFVLNKRGGLVAVLGAFIDRGALPDKAERVMCVACCLFKEGKYADFNRKWRTMHRRLGVPIFHATDFYGRWGDYKEVDEVKWRDVGHRMPEMINQHTEQVHAVSFREDEFWSVAGDAWRKKFGPSIYSAAVQLCLGVTGLWCERKPFNGEIVYVFEVEPKEDQNAANNAIVATIANPGMRRFTRYRSHAFVPKSEAAAGLEASDYFAWHWNKYYSETVFKRKRKMREDFKALIRRNPKKYVVYKYMDEALKKTVQKFLDDGPVRVA